jgi:hypothetical protein
VLHAFARQRHNPHLRAATAMTARWGRITAAETSVSMRGCQGCWFSAHKTGRLPSKLTGSPRRAYRYC